VMDTLHGLTARSDGSKGADFVFDLVANRATLPSTLAAVRSGKLGRYRGGELVIVGVPAPGVDVSARDILIGQKTVTASLGVFADPGTEIPEFAEWCAHGDIDLEALVTDRYRLDDINQAVADLGAGRIRGRAILTFS
jgi:Zn-dependent alcohol dehydrogenase